MKERVPFEDFSKNAFHVTIGKVQALALKKAGGRVPCPSDQLALVTTRRKTKRGRDGNPGQDWFFPFVTFKL